LCVGLPRSYRRRSVLVRGSYWPVDCLWLADLMLHGTFLLMLMFIVCFKQNRKSVLLLN